MNISEHTSNIFCTFNSSTKDNERVSADYMYTINIEINEILILGVSPRQIIICEV